MSHRSRFTAAVLVGVLSCVIVVAALGQGGKGSTFIGKLEGPDLVTDPAKMPKALKEAPQLAELVKADKLPPVAQRVGQDPLVIKPLREIGIRSFSGTPKAFFHASSAVTAPTSSSSSASTEP